jgi:hypothetical protein
VDVGGSAGKGLEQQPSAAELIGDVGSESDAVPGPLEGDIEAGEKPAAAGKHG